MLPPVIVVYIIKFRMQLYTEICMHAEYSTSIITPFYLVSYN